MSKNKLIQNNNISNQEDQIVADFLKKRNLERTNNKWPIPNPKKTIYTEYGKRICDIIISGPCIILLLPFYIVLAAAVFFCMGRPIIYKQTRTGKNGRAFNMLKFRSMNEKRDSNGELLPPSQRLTKFGKFIRKYSLDELPEFINVFMGDMSIIGPRPLPVFFADRMSERHKMRHSVKPGLECPYIIPEGSNLSAYHWKFENDIWYVENISFKTDIKMMINLFKLTFNMKNRESHAGGLSYFVGYDDNGHAVSLKKAQKIYLGSIKEQ